MVILLYTVSFGQFTSFTGAVQSDILPLGF
jgi:hypothetical protein